MIGVGRATPGARFRYCTLDDGLGTAAPDLDIETVLLFEGLDHGGGVFGDTRTVESERAFLPSWRLRSGVPCGRGFGKTRPRPWFVRTPRACPLPAAGRL